MKCLHGSVKEKCKVCYRLKQPKKVYYYEDTRKFVDGIPLVPTRKQKFCKKHLSIWGANSWWCLYTIWMGKGDLCEEEYLEVEL